MLDGIRAAVHADAHFTWVSDRFLDDNNVSAWMDMPVWVPGHGDTAGFAQRSIARAHAAGLTYRPLAVTAARHAGLVQDPARRPPGQAPRRPNPRPRSRPPGEVEGGPGEGLGALSMDS